MSIALSMIEKNVKKFLRGAKENDPEAQKALHSWLCIALSHLRETGEISDFVFNELHNQHMGIVHGESAAEATRTEKPQNAPRQALRDEGIYLNVKIMLDARKNARPLTREEAQQEQQLREMAKANPSMTFIEAGAPQEEVFKVVAAQYDGALSWHTIKRIYYKEKKERE